MTHLPPPVGVPVLLGPPAPAESGAETDDQFALERADAMSLLAATEGLADAEPVVTRDEQLTWPGAPRESRSAFARVVEQRTALWRRRDDIDQTAERVARLTGVTAEWDTAPSEWPASESDPVAELLSLDDEIGRRFTQLQTGISTSGRLRSELHDVPRLRRGRRRDVTEALAASEAEVETARTAIRSLVLRAGSIVEAAVRHLDELMTANSATLRDLEQTVVRSEHAPWQLERWLRWTPGGEPSDGELRLGSFREHRSGEILPVPCVVPFVGASSAVILDAPGDDHLLAVLGLMQSILLRTALASPGSMRHTIIAPGRSALDFPGIRHLGDVVLATGDTRLAFEAELERAHRVAATYLDESTTSFGALPEELRLSESCSTVLVVNYPHGYDLRSAQLLARLLRDGPRCGVHPIVHVDRNALQRAGAGFALPPDANVVTVRLDDPVVELGGVDGEIAFDQAPPPVLQSTVLHRVAEAPPRDPLTTWDSTSSVRRADWWSDDASEMISAPIGRDLTGAPLAVWFGHDEHQRRSCVHGLIGAMPGAGKSTFLHNLICSLAVRYRPDDLQFVLIDGKHGVEFQPYRTLPHARVVSLRTDPGTARSVVEGLVEEMTRRHGVFFDAGVQDLSSYRRNGSPAGTLPRILLVIDEYQQLFDDDDRGSASEAILRLSRQGRSAGIHFLLASQRFDVGAMRNRNEVFGNVHLRMAMQVSQSDLASMIELGVAGRRLVATHCDRAGRIVVNDSAGDDAGSVAGLSAMLTPERRDQLIEGLARRTADELPALAPPIVIDGAVAPDFADNPHLRELARLRETVGASALSEWSHRPLVSGGLGQTDWIEHERPLPLFLGREFNVAGVAMAVLRRRNAANLVVFGGPERRRLGLLGAALASAVTVRPDDAVELTIVMPVLDHPTTEEFDAVVEAFSSAGRSVDYVAGPGVAESHLSSLGAEIERRRRLPSSVLAALPTLVLALHEPDRLAEFHRQPDGGASHLSPTASQLNEILQTGPAVGVHVLVDLASLEAWRAILPDRTLASAQHRVVIDLPVEDAFVLVRSAMGLRPGDGDNRRCVLYDTVQQRITPFVPYGANGTDDPLASQVQLVLRTSGTETAS